MSTLEDRKRLKALARQGDLAGVQALLATVRTWEYSGLEDALQAAAAREDLVMMTAMLDAGAELRAGPLYVAAQRRNATMLALLLERGADIQQNDGSGTPLHKLLRRGYDEAAHLPLVRTLLKAGANPDPPHPFGRLNSEWEKLTPFQMALKHGARETALLLLDHGADINRRNAVGKSALMLATEKAVYKKDQSDLDWLLELGADPNAAEYDFQGTPLTIAAHWGHLELIDHLVEAGAAVSRNYALLEAARRGRGCPASVGTGGRSQRDETYGDLPRLDI
jgi:ankyrin repeat protein